MPDCAVQGPVLRVRCSSRRCAARIDLCCNVTVPLDPRRINPRGCEISRRTREAIPEVSLVRYAAHNENRVFVSSEPHNGLGAP